MVAGPALLGIVGLGAVGGILANIALTPLTAGASLLQSYWYGSGLILGERMMYTVHWEKIKGRLDKGEDFLQVLDTIMNDDITAIANLSFKAMDETGKLYLEKAGTQLGEFVEKLLSAILLANPLGLLGGGGTEPPPEGEPTPEGISLTISEVQAMSDNTLLFETQPSQISKYTEATQAHMLTEKLSRNITETNIDKDIDANQILAQDLLAESQLFLKGLAFVTLATFSSVWLPQLDGKFQSAIVNKLMANQMWLTMGTRNRSSGSDDKLIEYGKKLSLQVNMLFDQIKLNAPIGNLQTIQWEINLTQVLIFFHQLIYI